MYNVVAYAPEEQRRGRNEADLNACDYSIKSEYFGVEGYPSGRKGAVLKTVAVVPDTIPETLDTSRFMWYNGSS